MSQTRFSPVAPLRHTRVRVQKVHAPVVNDASDPFTVKPGLDATARTWYSVPHCRLAIVPPPIATALLPEPNACAGVVLPYAVVAPYWKNAVVALPCGLLVPFNVAPLWVTALAEPVATAGAH